MNFGTNILKNNNTEVTNISPFGFWILSNNKEYFVNFNDYPIFAHCSIKEIADISADVQGNFHWTSIDADIEKDALEEPEKYCYLYKN